MKQGASNRKVNEQAREVIASILLFDISDPRLQLVTITACEVSYDRSACNVFYTTEPERYEQTREAFASARGRIRSLMARRLSWRVAPDLRFHLDESVDEAEQIGRALNRDRARNEESGMLRAQAEAASAAVAQDVSSGDGVESLEGDGDAVLSDGVEPLGSDGDAALPGDAGAELLEGEAVLPEGENATEEGRA